MRYVRFGKTELQVSEVGFGGIPITRLDVSGAVDVVRHCLDLGINFIDTAHGYADSEAKIGEAIKGYPREKLVIATKAPAKDYDGYWKQLETSLERMGLDYIDIHQHHGVSSPEAMEEVLGPKGAYKGMVEAVEQGIVKHPGFSSHSLPIAEKLMKMGNWEVTQIPFNFVDNAAAEVIVPLAKELDMGFICMKPFGGGLLEEAALCFRFLMKFDSIVPDPGIETIGEIDEIVALYEDRRDLNAEEEAKIEGLREELGTSWCHRCEYCQPCPQGIKISSVLSAKSATKRMTMERAKSMLTGRMKDAEECTECRECVDRCPYDLEIPELLKQRRASWDQYVETGVWA